MGGVMSLVSELGTNPWVAFEMTTGMLESDAKQDSYRTDPVSWARDVLGIHMVGPEVTE